MKKLAFFLSFLLTIVTYSQEYPPSTPASDRMLNETIKNKLKAASIAHNIPFKCIGPTVFSGRVVDLDVSPDDPSHFYVAYASGGLWKTTNNGITFEPLFDHELVMTIGDIAVDWKHNIIWVGTGENNSSRSSYSGTGIYKSVDGGKSWQHKGLAESHHIGRIIINPRNPDQLWVAVLGHLYTANPERGVYSSTDGGDTWSQALYVDENTGAIDLIAEAGNPKTLYAAMWQRDRKAWNFVESGPGSGIYKSTNWGKSWTKMTTSESGFPVGEGVGRIGLDVHSSGRKHILYALLDNYFRRPPEEDDSDEDLTKDDLRNMSKNDFLELEEAKISEYLTQNRFPKKYTVKSINKMVREDEILPVALVEFIENANSLLFDTPVKGAEVYMSEDGGKSWQKTHNDYLESVYNSYGYYFGQIRVAPTNPDILYIMGVPILRSDDRGRTWKSINGDNVHVDHHALWVNPRRPGHLILGNDGGINISYDNGENWNKCNSPSVGQFYHIAVDLAKPYNVYGGLQDNGVWYGPHTNQPSTRWHSSGRYPFQGLIGGDGMQTVIDNRDQITVYTGSQFGNYSRINRKTGKRQRITPQHELGDRPYRWNWQAPILLSPHNQDIVYFGSNFLHRSFNRGDDFDIISGDLTTGGIKGDVAYSTLTTIDESKIQFGLIYTGSDDGLIHMTPDGGVTWHLISNELPQKMWISRVQASSHHVDRVYVCLNGYRWDDFNAYLYKSENRGKSWTRIGTDLPFEPINVIKEDPENEDLLYVGTDHGVYISLDQGEHFMTIGQEVPAAPVHDLVIHPREKDLLIGTHGRSIYLGNVAHLQQLNRDYLNQDLLVFEVDKVSHSSRWGTQFASWREPFTPKVQIPVFTPTPQTASLKIAMDEIVAYSETLELKKGIQMVPYGLTLDPQKVQALQEQINSSSDEDEDKKLELEVADDGNYYLPKGTYTLSIMIGDTEKSTKLVID